MTSCKLNGKFIETVFTFVRIAGQNIKSSIKKKADPKNSYQSRCRPNLLAQY